MCSRSRKRKIYIVLTYSGTVLSKIIKMYTKAKYSHVSIALDKNLQKMYSFGRKNPYNPFWAGFVHEQRNSGTFKRFSNTTTAIYSFEITQKQYQIIKKTIEKMHQEKKKYKFNIIGLIAVGFHIKYQKENTFYCAEFVKNLLELAHTEVHLPELIKPMDFENIQNLKLRYQGLLKNYQLS